MAQYVVFPDATAFPSEGTAYFVTANSLDAAINQAVSLYDLGGNFRVDRLSEDLHRYGVSVNVQSKTITVIDP
jgi:hypothetical protein